MRCCLCNPAFSRFSRTSTCDIHRHRETYTDRQTDRQTGRQTQSESSSKWHAWFARQAPLYLADDSRLVSDSTRRSLRSADVSTCVVPPTLGSYGDRTSAAAGPRLWNSIPVQLRNPDITYGLFRRQLNGHLFREA